MKNFARYKFVWLVFAALSVPVFGQSNLKIERELVAAIKEVQKYSNYGGTSDGDKLSAANDAFEKKLLKYTKIPSTLTYKFTELNKLMFLATSADGKFRIYSWDTETGGTMHDYARVYQFMGADGKVRSHTEKPADDEEGGAGSFVYDIFTLDAGAGSVYIACSTFIGSTNDHYQTASLYRIEGGALKDKVKLIKTGSGLTDSLSFEYNFFSVADRRERPVKLISFDRKTRTLKIPVVIEDSEFPNGRVTGKFISYRFNGTHFVKIS